MRARSIHFSLTLLTVSVGMFVYAQPALALVGEVLGEQKVSALEGGIVGGLGSGDRFGSSVTPVGDIDGDGVGDLASGASFDIDGGGVIGAVWLLFMNADGTLKTETKISATHGNAPAGLGSGHFFAASIAPLGDLDGNGVPDIAVGAPGDDDGGTSRGAVWILFLDATGSVESYQKISDTAGGFTGVLDSFDQFGGALASFGDLDGDTLPDLAVGAIGDDDGGGGDAEGAVWILFLNANGTVKGHQKISATVGGFTGALDVQDYFGSSVTVLGDLDGDTVDDIAVGATHDDDGGLDRGAVWVLFLNANGTVKGHQKVSDTTGGFTGVLTDGVAFGTSLGTIGLLDGDGVVDIVVGAENDDDGGSERGAAWVLFLNANGTVKAHQKISDTAGGFGGVLDDADHFGHSIAGVGDLDGDGTPDLAVGAIGDDDGGASGSQGAVWMLFLNSDGTVAAEEKISDAPGAFSEELSSWGYFGSSTTAIGDLDGDGVVDLAVGVWGDDTIGANQGAVWLLFMNADGTVKFDEKIGSGEGDFGGVLDDGDLFGASVAGLGDLDGDGVPDIAVGAVGDGDGGAGRGALWVLFLNADGTVKAHQKISDTAGGFGGTLDDWDSFGISVAPVGDLDGDGILDIAVGAHRDDDGGADRGAIWVLFLNADGSVKAHQKISGTAGGGPPDPFLSFHEWFGSSVGGIGDLDGDGIADIAVGAQHFTQFVDQIGLVWILFLNADGTVKTFAEVFPTAAFDGDNFGASVAPVGDLDGDGIADIAVGAVGVDDGGSNRGAVWIFFLNANGTVKSEQKISDTAGGFGGTLDDSEGFGGSVAPLGDLDGDGSPELAVGAQYDDDGASDAGAVWILTLDGFAASCGDGVVDPVDESCDDGNTSAGDGCSDECRVEDELHVTGTASGGVVEFQIWGTTLEITTSASDSAATVAAALAAAINAHPPFASLGITATAVGGTVYIAGSVIDASTTDAGLLVHFAPLPSGTLAAWYDFEGDWSDSVCHRDADVVVGTTFTTGVDGQGVAFDGVDDHLEVSADIGPTERPELTIGAWVNPDVVGTTPRAILSHDDGGFDRTLGIDDRNTPSSVVGWSTFAGLVANSDVEPVAGEWAFVAVAYDPAAGEARLHVDDASYVFSGVATGEGNADFWIGANPLGVHYFDGVLDDVFLFEKALSIEQVNDVRRLGNAGLAAIVDSVGPGEPYCREKVSATEGGFAGTLTDYDEFGRAIEALGDFDGDGIPDAVVGAPVAGEGALWVTFLNADGTVKSEQKIGAGAGGLTGPLDSLDLFGQSLGVFPDLDGDGAQDLAVGAIWDDDTANNAGAVYLLFLNSPAGTVASEVKITDTVAGLDAGDRFGRAVEVIGDLDGDGIPELAVSASHDDDGGSDRGAVYILFLDATGSVVGEQKISNTAGGFTGTLADGDSFGSDLASLGDLDGDDVTELAVGAFSDDSGGTNRGAVWILFLNDDGTVKSHQKIAEGVGDFTGDLDDSDEFGGALARLGDLDGDGVVDLAVGARKDDDGGPGRGAGWVLFLNANGTVKSHTKISDAAGGFGGRLDAVDWLGQGLASPGDLDGDGVDDLLIGASRDDDGGTVELGAFWALQLAGVPAVCGDGVQSALEQCDDGDADETDGCDNSCEIVPVPEPGQLAMLLAGLALLRMLHRRQDA